MIKDVNNQKLNEKLEKEILFVEELEKRASHCEVLK